MIWISLLYGGGNSATHYWVDRANHLTVASFTKEDHPRLAKRPLKTNGRLANRGLTSLVKEATGRDPSVKKRIGTSRVVSHTQHNSEPILGRNDSPLGCLHLTLAYI